MHLFFSICCCVCLCVFMCARLFSPLPNERVSDKIFFQYNAQHGEKKEYHYIGFLTASLATGLGRQGSSHTNKDEEEEKKTRRGSCSSFGRESISLYRINTQPQHIYLVKKKKKKSRRRVNIGKH